MRRLTDKIFGTELNDIILADDSTVASSADDLFKLRVFGGGGDDTLVGNARSTDFFGGAGADTFIVAADGVTSRFRDFDPTVDMIDLSAWGVQEFSQLRIEDLQLGAGEATSISFADEQFVIRNGAMSSLMTADQFVFASVAPILPDTVTLEPDDRNAVLPAGSGLNIVGNALSNNLTGNELANEISGSAGGDTITGFGGADALYGGEGADFLVAGDADDSVFGGAARDSLFGGNGADQLFGGSGTDQIFGGDGNDALFAEDRFRFQPGNDVLFGGAGDDLLDGSSSESELFGGSGNDTLFGGFRPDQLFGGAGDDLIEGGGAFPRSLRTTSPVTEQIHGDDGDDVLIARGPVDVFGGAGNDTIETSSFATDLFGGAGADIFVIGELDDGRGSSPLIHGFEKGIDRVDLSASGATEIQDVLILHGSDTTFVFAGSTGVSIRTIDDNPVLDLGADDFIFSDTPRTTISGTDGDDKIRGTSFGEDIIDGSGVDIIFGNGGLDIFRMSADGEVDSIKNFVRGEDQIDVSAWGVTSLDQLEIRTTGPNVLRDYITFGDEALAVGVAIERNGSVVRIEGEAFLESDFIFA